MVGGKRPPHQDSQAARPPGRADHVSHAPPLRGAGAAVWLTAPTIPVARRRTRPGTASRYGLGGLAHAAADRPPQAPALRASIFTAVRSRYRFVYPTFEETTACAIEACEAAWAFFGGRFHVLIPDNTKAIILEADPLAPRITPAFLIRAGARSSHRCGESETCPTKPGSNALYPGVRDDCFAGEILTTLEDARAHALHWCHDDYGGRPHGRTQRRPREHFEAAHGRTATGRAWPTRDPRTCGASRNPSMMPVVRPGAEDLCIGGKCRLPRTWV